jgi:hypothetical protein
MLAGSPIGTDAYMDRVVRPEVETVRTLTSLISRCLADGKVSHTSAAQAMTAVVRLVLCQKLTHLGRATPSQFTEPYFSLLDRDLLDLVAQLAQFRPPDGYWDTSSGQLAADRIHLKISCGGLGIPSLAGTCHNMYLGSLALTLPVVYDRGFLCCGGAPLTEDNLPNHAALSLPYLSHSLDASCVRDVEALTDLTPVSLYDEPRKHVQRLLTTASSLRMINSISGRIQDLSEKAWFLSLTSPEAGSFLKANWMFKGKRMSNSSWATALCLRVGWPVLPLPSVCPYDPGRVVATNGLHAFCCTMPSLTGHRSRRHNIVNGTLENVLRAAAKGSGFLVKHEPMCVDLPVAWTTKPGVSRGDHDRGDIFVYNEMDGADRHLVDVVVQSPVTQHLTNAQTRAGYAAQEAHTRKIRSYTQRFNFPERELVPCAFETTGRMHPFFYSWLKTMMKKLSPTDHRFKFHDALERLSIAVQLQAVGIITAFKEHQVLAVPAGDSVLALPPDP